MEVNGQLHPLIPERSWYCDWLRAGLPRGRSSSPGRVKNFHFTMSLRPAAGPTQPLLQLVPGGSFRGGKCTGRGKWNLHECMSRRFYHLHFIWVIKYLLQYSNSGNIGPVKFIYHRTSNFRVLCTTRSIIRTCSPVYNYWIGLRGAVGVFWASFVLAGDLKKIIFPLATMLSVFW
jgi:hypothetical protein